MVKINDLQASLIKPWPVTASRIEAHNGIFTLTTRTARSPRTGGQHEFHVLEAGEWVNVVPVTKDEQVLMVRQYRHGTGEVTLEIPGGLVDPGETSAQAAARELLEETGYSGTLSPLGRVRPNPAIQNNWCYTYLARDLTAIGEVALDDSEDIELLAVPLDRIPALIARGIIDHALVLSAFFFFFSPRLEGSTPDPTGMAPL